MEDKHGRRDFLKTGTIGLAGLTIFGRAKGEMSYAAAGDPFPELVEITILQLQAMMRAKQLTSRRIVEMYLERIKQIDPLLRSVIEVNPDALTIADQMDRERRNGKARSTLHGIPILLKDNIDTGRQDANDSGLACASRRTGAEA
jgi:amidase